MKRLIRAVFPTPPMPLEYKKPLLDQIPQNRGYQEVRDLIQSLDNFPPFQSFSTDDRGRLFVAGFNKDPVSSAYMADVFSLDGLRLLRVGLGYQDLFPSFVWGGAICNIVLKNGRCYCVREKPDGFKEVVVSSMIWR